MRVYRLSPMTTILPSIRTMFFGMALLSSAATAFAQVPAADPYDALFVTREIAASGQPQAIRPTMATAAAQIPSAPIQQSAGIRQTPRPLLPALYAGNIALQVMDTHSTFRALDAGLVESNPVMRWTTAHPVAFVSMKAAATATTILVSEKIRKKYPWRAALFMAGVNSAYALIVSHNYRATSR
jgi:Domain of unknown function (DUF5658)